MARQSVYPTSAIDLLNHLDDCVNFTEAAAASLQSSLNKFETGISDLPRLTKILANKHVRAPNYNNDS
jgi:DASH complex subunit SPC19